MSPNPSMLSSLRDQALAIHQLWLDGSTSTARAMLAQVPAERIPYMIMTMTILAVHGGDQYAFSKFIEEATS